MKRIVIVVCALLLLLIVPCASMAQIGQSERETSLETMLAGPLAVVPPQTGKTIMRRAVAVTQTSEGTVPMYAQPSESSDVLMTYYCGAPLEVIRAAGGGFYLVQAGAQEAGVMGYMRAQDIRIGDAAGREVQPCFMRLEFNHEVPVYAYCDEGAQVIGLCDVDHVYYAMGKNDGKWVQLFLPPQTHVWEEEDRLTYGFAKLETGMARGYWQELEQWEAQPVEGEITQEQAIAIALAYLDGSGMGGMPDVYTDGAQLEKMDRRAYMRVHQSDQSGPRWWVFFWQRAGSDAAYAVIGIDQDGDVDMSQGYISADNWGAYTVTPTL